MSKSKPKSPKAARLTRTKNTKAADTCKATASSGHLVCVLEKHSSGPHSTAPRGGKPMQHATWLANDAGQVVVTTFSRGKRQSEWTEAAPPIAAPALDPVVEDIKATFGDAVESIEVEAVAPDEDDPRPAWLREQTAQRDVDGRDSEPASLIDPCKKCGRELGEHDGKKCPKSTISKERLDIVFSLVAACANVGVKTDELSSIHRGALRELERTGRITYRNERWFAAELDQPRAGSKPLTLDDEPEGDEPSEAALAVLDQEDEHDPFVADEPDELEMRTLARQHREDREAHAGKVGDIDPAPSPTATSSPTTPSFTVGPTITCRGKAYPIHPAARIFPTPEVQYRALVESMRVNGQKHKVQRLNDPENDNPVIDGCSRLRACDELGIDPLIEFINVDNPYRHVFAVNLDRRHLDESQRAMAAADLANMEHGANQHTRSGGSAGPPLVTQAEAAKLAGASERLTRAAAQVKNNAVPEVTQAIREGRIRVGAGVELAKLQPAKQREILDKVTKGKGEVRSGKVRSLVKQEEKREIVRRINTGRVAPMPMGPFGVIYGDYPWWYDNSDQHEGSRGHMEYPGMKMPEILAHARETAKRAANDCVLALWFTNLYVREIGMLVDAYGATHHTMWTWPKPRAGVGTWGRGQTEHLIIASIGAPVHTLNEVSTLLPAYALREPGRKPDEVAALLAQHCGGPFLELFAREPREDWATWGAEADGSKAIEPKRKSKILTETDKRMAAGAPA